MVKIKSRERGGSEAAAMSALKQVKCGRELNVCESEVTDARRIFKLERDG